MPEKMVSITNAADLPAGNRSEQVGVYTCGQLSAARGTRILHKPQKSQLEASYDRPLNRELRRSGITSVLTNIAPVRLNHVKLPMTDHFQPTEMAASRGPNYHLQMGVSFPSSGCLQGQADWRG